MRIDNYPHDKVVRKALENPVAAHEFLETNLPEDVKSALNLTTLKMESESFIEPKLKESICDILYSVKLKNQQDGYIYCLIEHQSTPQHWMAFRILKYMTAIWERYLNLNPKSKYLPPIYPIVYYTGTKPYNAPTDLWSLFQNKELAHKFFMEGYKLINIQKEPDEITREKLWLSTLNFFLKHIRDKDLLGVWEQIIHNLPELIKATNGDEYVKIFISYTLTKMEKDDTIKLKAPIKD